MLGFILELYWGLYYAGVIYGFTVLTQVLTATHVPPPWPRASGLTSRASLWVVLHSQTEGARKQ